MAKKHILVNQVGKLLALKEQKELKQILIKDIAEDTGLHRNTISNMLNHKNVNYNDETIVALCIYFDCEPGDLFKLVEVEVSEDEASGQNTRVVAA